MFDGLLLHKQTLARLKDMADEPSQGYLFVAPPGSGKRLVADRLAKHWSNGNVGYVHIIEPSGASIGIDQVHAIRPLLSQRVSEGTRQVIVFDQAAKLTLEAQSSLLKALEEPRVRTTFVLLTEDSSQLLPTVRSRLTEVTFTAIDQNQLIKWAQDNFELSPDEARRGYHIGGGTPGGIANVADSSSGTATSLETARRFLQSDPYTRVKIVSDLQGQNRAEIREFIMMLAKLISAALNNLQPGADHQTYRRFGDKLQLILQSSASIERYANPRLVLSRLVLEL